MDRTPILLVMAGPNGSGKSTVTNAYPPIGEYVNADEIQRYRRCSTLEAAQIAERTREFLLSEGVDFTFETVLSTDRNLKLMQRAKQKGYRVICIYVLTKDPSINVRRVKARVEQGGHDVPEEKIVARYQRAMKLFPQLFTICDEVYVYDNSLDRGDGEPGRIIEHHNGNTQLLPTDVWTKEMLLDLLEGEYAQP